jgi:UDP-N-acetylmuramate dehydrogenase
MINVEAIRGRLRQNVELANRTWFRVGGVADWLFTPEDEDDLCEFLRLLPAELPLTVIGVGSNLLVRDGGIEGVVVRLGRGFAGIEATGKQVIAGAGALDVNVANAAAQAGIAGFEFLVGIPGTIGGAVRMNAGAYGSDISQIATEIYAVDRAGRKHHVKANEAGFSYRHSELPSDWIITKLVAKGVNGDAQAIKQNMDKIMQERAEAQPVRSRTGGSTFKNPPSHKAWQLIDEAGCRGLRLGDAQISELHCNFMLNNGQASAADLEGLGEQVRARVLSKTGVELEWEIKRIGRK